MGPRSYSPTLFFFGGGEPYDTITECNAHCGKEPWKDTDSRCEPFCSERLQASYDLLAAKPLPAPASAWQPGPVVAPPDYFAPAAAPPPPPQACNTKACLATGPPILEGRLGALAAVLQARLDLDAERLARREDVSQLTAGLALVAGGRPDLAHADVIARAALGGEDPKEHATADLDFRSPGVLPAASAAPSSPPRRRSPSLASAASAAEFRRALAAERDVLVAAAAAEGPAALPPPRRGAASPARGWDDELLAAAPAGRAGALARPTRWRYEAADGKGAGIRKAPSIDAERTGDVLASGEVFAVSEEKEGRGGVTFLRLQDGRGWLFDRKPGVGALCTRVPERAAPEEEEEGGAELPEAPAPRAAAAAEPPGGGRRSLPRASTMGRLRRSLREG
ncbi:unnamed protein product [Prorocentrum cordatum]|uniref:Uncharacterized protein n=1 Tax=Prorocentrum cordatum TaxID=2364126 RepID=A0ABN9ULB1_9DINO|nr:unnamed protein product [Polarella glacialis]